jgi:hypothetical protein
MKKSILFIVLFISSLIVSAQEINSENNPIKNNNDGIQTLFGHPESVTAYCAFIGKYGEFYSLPTWDLGMQIGCIVDHWFGMGLIGYGTVQEPLYNAVLQDNYSLHGGYGGVYFEPILFPKYPVHIAFPILLGAGGLKYDINNSNNSSFSNSDALRSNPFLVAEPGAELELNFFRHFRISFGGHYRITSPLSISYRQKDALNGFTGSISLKFGTF